MLFYGSNFVFLLKTVNIGLSERKAMTIRSQCVFDDPSFIRRQTHIMSDSRSSIHTCSNLSGSRRQTL